jgi:putative membrane protein
MERIGGMAILSLILVGLVALEHVYILILEMFLWTTPRGQRAFGTTPAFARESRSLAANQGLYNGFLAAGLFWGIAHPNP